MAENDEEVKTEPSATMSTPLDYTPWTSADPDPTTGLKDAVKHEDTKVHELVNSGAVIKPPAVNLPVLPEVEVTGYFPVGSGDGYRTEPVLACVIEDTFKLEKNAAYDFILMREAAKKDGIILKINTAYRTMDEQTRIWEERKDPAVRAKKGPAAKPGRSNHQQGIAVDISVKMVPDWRLKAVEELMIITWHYSAEKAKEAVRHFEKTKKLDGNPVLTDEQKPLFQKKIDNYTGKTKEFLWLVDNAAKFGFDNDEAPTEAWHWRHKQKKIIGINSVTPDLVAKVDIKTDAAATAAVDNGRVNMDVLIARDTYDRTQALARSALMTRTTRDTLYAHAAAASVYRSGAASNYAALVTKVRAALRSDAATGYQNGSTDSATFDFDTGKWLG